MTTARVVIDGAVFSYDKWYDYIVPQELYNSCLAGCRVTVPFGRGNTVRQGTVVMLAKTENADKLKSILTVEDKEPILSDEMLKICEYMREHTFCTYSDAIRTLLPFGLNLHLVTEYTLSPAYRKPLSDDMQLIANYIRKNGSIKSEKLCELCGVKNDSALPERLYAEGFLIKHQNARRRMNDLTVKTVRAAYDLPDNIKLSPKQNEVYSLLCDIGAASVKEVCYHTGVTAAVIKALEKKGAVIIYDQEVLRPAYCKNTDAKPKPIDLSDEQQKVYEGILELVNQNKPSTALLYGVTGSGKTQVYLKLTDYTVSNGKGVIVMVPEIALTPQTLALFSNRYGEKIAVFHSAMSVGQRMDEYKRVKNGEALIAIGTRSAVFAPFKEIGLIIMDEEQEHTYKSEMSPRFHARDIARFRASYHNCTVVLSSATPTVETYAAAKAGKYKLFTLAKRYGKAMLPQVVTVDMKKEMLSGNSCAISTPLADAIKQTLNDNNQCVILLNRRGHNTYISCPSCGYVAGCPNCSISMTYHSANNRLMCHYCGYSVTAQKLCPTCSKPLRYFGIGTQKVEEELKALFPNARVLRMDADSVTTKNSYAEKLNAFANYEYDILLGTQMVAKGLNFPKVTLVGVLGADQTANSEDYRSFERTFSLLTQVVGRSGRGDAPGTAIIQTYDPKARIIELAAKQDYDTFFNEEILTRKLLTYPPYCDIAALSAVSEDKGTAVTCANKLLDEVKTKAQADYSDVNMIVLGPVPPAVPKVNNRYRYRLIIKCRANARFRAMLREIIDSTRTIPYFKNCNVYVDINPGSNM